MTFANSIYLCYECKCDEKTTNDIHVKKFYRWGICPAAIHVIPIKRQYIYKKTIYDIGTEILNFQCLNCFKTRLFCKSIIPEDSKISRRDLSFPSVKSRFKAIFKKKWFFRLSMKFTRFVHQYFDSLPPKIWSYRYVIFFPDSSRWNLSSYKVSKG